MKRTVFLVAAYLLAAAGEVRAEEPVSEDLVETKLAEKADKAGWFPTLDVGANFQLGHSHQVVGQTDGVTIALGAAVLAGLVMEKGPHEWSTSLGWKFALTRSPDLDAFSKGQDDVFFQTRYLYSFPKVTWLGVFGKFRLESAFLPGWKVSLSEADVVIEDWEGNEQLGEGYHVGPGDRVSLTESFSPLLLKENVGLMATPVDRKEVKLEINLGIGSHQFFGLDGLRVGPDDDPAIFELEILKDYVQVGGAFETRIMGAPHAVFEYSAGAELMQPFYTSLKKDLRGIEFLNVRIDGMLRFKLWSFLTIDISLEAKRYPLVAEEWQVATNLLVNFHFEYPKPAVAPACPPCPECPACPGCPDCPACPEGSRVPEPSPELDEGPVEGTPDCPDCPDCPPCPESGAEETVAPSP